MSVDFAGSFIVRDKFNNRNSMLLYNQLPNPFSFRPMSEKERSKLRIRNNQRKGQAGENMVWTKYALMGYEVERTGRGHDLRVRRRDLLTNRVVESKVVEVKTGNAKLSELQQKMKKKMSNYKVERVDPLFY